jgi:hypothetical protein
MAGSVEDRGVKEPSLQPCHAGNDQALNEQHQLLLMFRQKVGDPSTEVWRLSMSDKDFAVNDAIHIQLALDADRLIQGERQVRGEVQPLFRDVPQLTESCGLLLHHKTASRDGHAKLVALVGHQTDLLAESDRPSFWKHRHDIASWFGLIQRSASITTARIGKGTRLMSMINIKGDMFHLLLS